MKDRIRFYIFNIAVPRYLRDAHTKVSITERPETKGPIPLGHTTERPTL